jgi:energy-coupling factor transporter ATP-binding protein EcfA2
MTTLFISHSSKDNDWAEELRKGLEDQGYQSLFLDFHPDEGIHTGEDWERTLYQKLRQCRGVVALCSRDWLASPWCVSEAILARERGKPVFLMATSNVTDDNEEKKGPRVPKFLQDKQFISLDGLTRQEAHERLWKDLEKWHLKDDFPLPDQPYPGLEPFTENDAAIFFGRDAKIDEVRETLARIKGGNAKGFIVVLGASGCGKSSLVKAGVLPRLRKPKNVREVEKDWLIAEPFPGGEGLTGLAESLARLGQETGLPGDVGSIRDRISPTGDSEYEIVRCARALTDLAVDLRSAVGHRGARVLLVVDQLEEVFGREENAEVRSLLSLLISVTRPMRSPIIVLATMRSDFLNAFQLFPGMSDEYEKITLDPMPKARFGEVIEGPADRFGLRLDPGLTERLVEDTAYDDALPLLAFTLKELYEKCKPGGQLSIEAYEELFPPVEIRDEKGNTTVYRGVSAAIKHVADKILDHAHYQGLPPESTRLRDLRRAFHMLAQVGEADQVTKRKALWSQMPASCEGVQSFWLTSVCWSQTPRLMYAHPP